MNRNPEGYLEVLSSCILLYSPRIAAIVCAEFSLCNLLGCTILNSKTFWIVLIIDIGLKLPTSGTASFVLFSLDLHIVLSIGFSRKSLIIIFLFLNLDRVSFWKYSIGNQIWSHCFFTWHTIWWVFYFENIFIHWVYREGVYNINKNLNLKNF